MIVKPSFTTFMTLACSHYSRKQGFVLDKLGLSPDNYGLSHVGTSIRWMFEQIPLLEIKIIEYLPLSEQTNDLIGQDINYNYFIIVHKNKLCKTNFITWPSKTPITGLETLISTRKL